MIRTLRTGIRPDGLIAIPRTRRAPPSYPSPMNAGSQLFAALAALIYIVVFPLESFFLRPRRRRNSSTWCTLGATVAPLIALAALLF